MTASLLRSLGPLSVSWPISTMLSFRWSGFVFWFQILPAHFSSFWGTLPSAPTTIDITVTSMFHSLFVYFVVFFLVLNQRPSICLSFHFLLFSLFGPSLSLLSLSPPSPLSLFSLFLLPPLFFLFLSLSLYLSLFFLFLPLPLCLLSLSPPPLPSSFSSPPLSF